MTMFMDDRSPLNDPHVAQYAWARHRRVMGWMMLTTVTLVIGAIVALYRSNGLVPVYFYIVGAMGIGFVMLLMSAVMGMRFLSGRTGPDDVNANPGLPEDERNR